MERIEHRDMGDVWPTAQPGKEGDYGTAILTPVSPCEIRSFQTFTITYTAGKFGLDDTGAIRIACRFVQDGGPWQISDPSAANYVTATCSNGTELTLYPEPYAYRPWYVALRVTVSGGFLRPGDTITVVIGDRSGGSPGFRMQTIAEAAMDFTVSADTCATGQFAPLRDRLSVPVVAGPARGWRLVLPTLRRPGEPFALGISAEDHWGNPTFPGPGPWQLRAEGQVSGLPEMISFSEGQKAARIDALTCEDAGILRIGLVQPGGADPVWSNPVCIEAGDHAAYWGDLHGQSGETVGIGTIAEYLEFARDLAFLDVSGHQANDFQITNAFWERINATTQRMNSDGRFIVYPGYEWSGNTPVGGDHNVFFGDETGPLVRSSHAMLSDRSDIDTDANTLDALFDAMRGRDCVIWSHVGGRPADVGYAHDPTLKTAVELHSNWGSFEWILTDSLALGHRVGVVCNSDGHKGRPGAGPPGATEFGAYGGLTCFLAPNLTRGAIFEAMRRRRHYGTTGGRIHLDLRAEFETDANSFARDPRYSDLPAQVVRAALMGDIVETDEREITVNLNIEAASPIERVDILNGAECVETLRSYGPDEVGRRLRVYWQGAEYRGRGRNTRWRGVISVNGAEFTAMSPVNRWNPERPLVQKGVDRVEFEAVTSGNFAGVDLMLDHAESATVAVETNHVSGRVCVGKMRMEDAVFDAGGLGRQIRVRRLPDDIAQRSLQQTIRLPLAKGRDNPVWVRVTTLDGHMTWSSPIYLIRSGS